MQRLTIEPSAPSVKLAPAVSHFVPFDEPGRRSARALCGARVDRRASHWNPTCEACRQQLAADATALNDLTAAHEGGR
jgi:hypothetical protein